jgi:hypothetical protein
MTNTRRQNISAINIIIKYKRKHIYKLYKAWLAEALCYKLAGRSLDFSIDAILPAILWPWL